VTGKTVLIPAVEHIKTTNGTAAALMKMTMAGLEVVLLNPICDMLPNEAQLARIRQWNSYKCY